MAALIFPSGRISPHLSQVSGKFAAMNLLVTALFLFLLAAPASAQEMFTGKLTQVRDGDTIEVSDVPVRLYDVAARDPMNHSDTQHGTSCSA